MLKSLRDALERAGWTFIQQFVGLIAAAGALSIPSVHVWGAAASTAAFAVVVSLGTTVISLPFTIKSESLDLLVRVAKTFAQSTVATVVAAGVTDLFAAGWLDAMKAASVVAFGALTKGLIALIDKKTAGASTIGMLSSARHLAVAKAEPVEGHPITDAPKGSVPGRTANSNPDARYL